MRLGLIAVITVISIACIYGCKKKENLSLEQDNGKIAAAMQETEDKVKAELTDQNFGKGKNIAGISMTSLQMDKPVSIGAVKGKKIYVDFWASWCVPCIEMFPLVERLKKEYADNGGPLQVISVSVDPMPAKIKEIIKSKGVTFEVLQAPVSLQESGILLPFAVITDEEGTVINTTNGAHTYEELKEFTGMK